MTEQRTMDAPEQVDASELNLAPGITPVETGNAVGMLGVSLGWWRWCCGAYWRPRRAAPPEISG